jgi:hypothetical protein
MIRSCALASLVLLASCGPRNGHDVVEPPDKGPVVHPTWEVVYVLSTTSDVGDCQNLEHMDKEVHITSKIITVYVSHYTGTEYDKTMGEMAHSGVEKKLVRTIQASEQPAASIIAAIQDNQYYSYSRHETFSIGEHVMEDCSDEVESITVLTPKATGIATFEHGPDFPPADGMAKSLYDLIKAAL